jgi:[ribosomal protein S18]-alanine N-acetyltransferase
MSRLIRRMIATDMDAVLSLEQQTPEAPHWKREDYEDCLSPEAASLQRAAFVAESQNGVLGFSVAKLIAGVAELETVVVALSVRQQGIGEALLQAAVSWAQEQGATRFELEVRSSNHRAIRLYERSGMRREGLRPGYYQSPVEDALLMGMTLPGGGKLI